MIDPVAVNAVLIAVRQAAHLLCVRWTLLILLAAHGGVTRFADFRERCGAANRLLSSRLLMLEEERRGAYRLTEKGLDLFPVLVCIEAWADEWQLNRYRSPVHLTHRPCGQPLKLLLRCDRCAEPLQRGGCNLHSG